MESSFAQLGLSKWLVDTLSSMSITKPTNIQAKCIPPILEGRDCIGGSKTGSGKTIAFMAPILEKWSEDPKGIFGLILTPTRELALQISQQVSILGAHNNLKYSVILGGTDMIKQSLELKGLPHIVIATPGRLADHIRSCSNLNSLGNNESKLGKDESILGNNMNNINNSDDNEFTKLFKRLKFLVLDEADRLLTDSFSDDLKTCLSVLPKPDERQTLLFSATITDSVRKLKEMSPKNGKKPPFMVELWSLNDKLVLNEIIPKTLSQFYLFIPSFVCDAYLHSIITSNEFVDKNVIVFVNRTRIAEILYRSLKLLEIKVTSLHSEMKQSERINSLERFRAGYAKVLIGTDVASRGLDIPLVELVINYDLPADPDDYIHRIGRTARAGRNGTAISFVTEKSVEKFKAIEDRINTKIPKWENTNENKVIKNSLSQFSKAKREIVIQLEKENFGQTKDRHKKLKKLRQKRAQ